MTQQQPEQPADAKDLKAMALLERVSELTTAYENQDADRRVQITLLGQRVKELEEQIQQLKAQEDADVVQEEATVPKD